MWIVYPFRRVLYVLYGSWFNIHSGYLMAVLLKFNGITLTVEKRLIYRHLPLSCVEPKRSLRRACLDGEILAEILTFWIVFSRNYRWCLPQGLFEAVNRHAAAFGMRINASKKKVMWALRGPWSARPPWRLKAWPNQRKVLWTSCPGRHLRPLWMCISYHAHLYPDYNIVIVLLR